MDIEVKTVPVGILETNCYIVTLDGDIAVIDPGDDAEKIIAEVKNIPRYILITHGHFDHVLALDDLTDRFKTTQILASDSELIKKLNMQGTYYGVPFPKIRTKITPVRDALKIPFGSSYFEVIETPGHTPQAVCYKLEDRLFSGDTLFAGAHGRVDLTGSDPAKMQVSLKRLSKLSRDTKVYPGHGRTTTIGNEIESGLLS